MFGVNWFTGKTVILRRTGRVAMVEHLRLQGSIREVCPQAYSRNLVRLLLHRGRLGYAAG